MQATEEWIEEMGNYPANTFRFIVKDIERGKKRHERGKEENRRIAQWMFPTIDLPAHISPLYNSRLFPIVSSLLIVHFIRINSTFVAEALGAFGPGMARAPWD
jgi:hypothetical protein